jgi:hypothetical protein
MSDIIRADHTGLHRQQLLLGAVGVSSILPLGNAKPASESKNRGSK